VIDGRFEQGEDMCKALRALAAAAMLASGFVVAQEDGELKGDPVAGKALADKVCAACHGENGNAIIEVYPDLAGQNAAYLVYALQAYKDGQRFGGYAGIMVPQAKNLTEQQMADVAAYYAGL
jgi:cytochrome c553